MADRTEDCEVAIVGLGPVGCALANLLGQYDISTVILERESAAYHLPRAVAFDDEVMRIFQSMGLVEEMVEISETGGGVKFVDGDGNTLVSWERPPVKSVYGWYVSYRFHQPDLENVLRQGFARFPCISARWTCDVTGLNQFEDGVMVTYRDTTTGDYHKLRARYVVGCDGGRSFTRTSINSEIEDLGFHEPWLVVDLLMRKPETISVRHSFHYCDPKRSATRVFLGAKRKRWELRLNTGDDPDEISKPENVWRLLARWIGPHEATLERATVYTFHSTIAKQWRQGRLLIAGDAAHQTPPFMGQGMCAGIRDVANLSWKLERILKRGAPDALLDSYQTERRPHVKEYIDLTVQMGLIINRTTSEIIGGNATAPVDGPQKLTQLRPTLGPGLSAGQTKLTGHLFPQPRLSSGELLDDCIGNRSALIFRSEVRNNFLMELSKQLTEHDVALIDDPSDELRNWFDGAECNAVMLRPDRYILGTATTPGEIADLVSNL